jgi:hypothetical protein
MKKIKFEVLLNYLKKFHFIKDDILILIYKKIQSFKSIYFNI